MFLKKICLFIIIFSLVVISNTACGRRSPNTPFAGDLTEKTQELAAARESNISVNMYGGYNVILTPEYPDGLGDRDVMQDLATAKVVLESRLDNLMSNNKDITIDIINKEIGISVYWEKNEKRYDPQVVIKDIVVQALLTFQEVDEDKTDANGNYLPTGRIVIDGADIKDAQPYKDQQTNYYGVELKLTASGQDKFTEATGRLVGRKIAIFMDDMEISHPVVNQMITGDTASITGSFTKKSAKALADSIRSGGLPCKLEITSIDSINAK